MKTEVLFLVLLDGNIDHRERMPRWYACLFSVVIWFVNLVSAEKLTTRHIEIP